MCKGGAAIAAWQKDNPEPEGGTLLGVEFETPDSRDDRSEEQRARDDIRAMLLRNGQPIPPELM